MLKCRILTPDVLKKIAQWEQDNDITLPGALSVEYSEWLKRVDPDFSLVIVETKTFGTTEIRCVRTVVALPSIDDFDGPVVRTYGDKLAVPIGAEGKYAAVDMPLEIFDLLPITYIDDDHKEVTEIGLT